MKRIFILTTMVLIFAITIIAQNNKLKFYEGLPFNGKNGNIVSIEETKWKVISADDKNPVNINNPSEVLYIAFDMEGRVDSVNTKIEAMSALVNKIYYNDDNTTRSIRNHIILDSPDVISEAHTIWVDDKTQTEEEKDLKTGKIISSSTSKYDFESKICKIEKWHEIANYGKIENKSVFQYKNNRLHKIEAYDANNTLSSSSEFEYNDIDNSSSKVTMVINHPYDNSIPPITQVIEYKNKKYDKHNNRVEWEEYRDGKIENVCKARIVYR